MIAVIFEVVPADGERDHYLQRAASLRPILETMDGFISVERFQSLSHPERLLSLSFWRDEAAVLAWRQLEEHRAAQRAGRGGVFADYRLRVAQVLRDYGLHERDQAPHDSLMAHGQAMRPSDAPTSQTIRSSEGSGLQQNPLGSNDRRAGDPGPD